MARETPKLSRVEIVGAWLGLWEPPRDARVPPVPWRTLALALLALAAVGGAAAAVIAPRVDDAKDRSSARERAALAERAAARRARTIREQRPRRGAAAGADSRGEVLTAVEAAIGADARKRFNPRARAAICDPVIGADLAADRVGYECTSAIRDIVGAGEQEGAIGTLAIPFRAVVDHRARTYVFCKVNPPPSEQVIPDPRTIVRLPRACRAPRPAPS
jgi:hypothetical protein